MSALTVYQRIINAAHAGKGLRLTAKDAWALSMDDAIATAASNDWEAQGGPAFYGPSKVNRDEDTTP